MEVRVRRTEGKSEYSLRFRSGETETDGRRGIRGKDEREDRNEDEEAGLESTIDCVREEEGGVTSIPYPPSATLGQRRGGW